LIPVIKNKLIRKDKVQKRIKSKKFVSNLKNLKIIYLSMMINLKILPIKIKIKIKIKEIAHKRQKNKITVINNQAVKVSIKTKNKKKFI
jgi:hypothetical protein